MTGKKKTQYREKSYGRTEFQSFITPAVLQRIAQSILKNNQRRDSSSQLHSGLFFPSRHRRAKYKAMFEHFVVSVTFGSCITNTYRDNYMTDLALIRINTLTIDVLFFPDSVRKTECARPSG